MTYVEYTYYDSGVGYIDMLWKDEIDWDLHAELWNNWRAVYV